MRFFINISRERPPSKSRRRAFLASALLVTAGGCSFGDESTLSITLPDSAGIATMSTSFTGNYVTTFHNRYGGVSKEVEPVGRHKRHTNLYYASNGLFATIDGGGVTSFFRIKQGSPPSIVNIISKYDMASDRWSYLGSVRFDQRTGPVYYPASQAPECIPLYGEGLLIYRKIHQSLRRC